MVDSSEVVTSPPWRYQIMIRDELKRTARVNVIYLN